MDSLLLRQIKDDRHLSNCLEFMDQLKKLVLYSDEIGKRALPALTPHFTTLEHLTIPLGSHITGELTLAVLESCPMLKYLQGSRVWASQIMKSKLWICLKLRRSKVNVAITITFSKDTPVSKDGSTLCAQSRAVFERLSKSEDLIEIDIRGPQLLKPES